jgi:hypothetical protein
MDVLQQAHICHLDNAPYSKAPEVSHCNIQQCRPQQQQRSAVTNNAVPVQEQHNVQSNQQTLL